MATAGMVFLLAGHYIQAKAVLAQYLLQSSWQKTLDNRQINRPWPWADTYPVARLMMERLKVDLIVLEGEQGAVLAFGPGHLPASSLPQDGGNCVLAGHRDTSFSFLKELKVGDKLIMEDMNGKRHQYQVQDLEVREFSGLYLQNRSGWLSLITCYPFDAVRPGTPLRYVVSAMQI